MYTKSLFSTDDIHTYAEYTLPLFSVLKDVEHKTDLHRPYSVCGIDVIKEDFRTFYIPAMHIRIHGDQDREGAYHLYLEMEDCVSTPETEYYRILVESWTSVYDIVNYFRSKEAIAL